MNVRKDSSVSPRPEEHALLPSTRLRVPEHVVYRAVGDETVVLDLNRGTYHGLNATGGHMLEAIESAGSVAEAIALVAERYVHHRERIEEDFRAFCSELLDRGLLERVTQ